MRSRLKIELKLTLFPNLVSLVFMIAMIGAFIHTDRRIGNQTNIDYSSRLVILMYVIHIHTLFGLPRLFLPVSYIKTKKV